jgi:hypothetical protein
MLCEDLTTDYRRIDRVRKQFFKMSRHERHLAHRHLLDVRRNAFDKSITDNSTHVGCRISRSDRQALEAFAELNQTTPSALMREMIRTYLQQETNKRTLRMVS